MSVENPHAIQSVLIVDDDPILVAHLTALLLANNYTVLSAPGIRAATEIVNSMTIRFDLAIVDLVLGLDSGLEMIEILKNRNSATKILATTGGRRKEHLEVALRFGADAVFQKPSPDDPSGDSQWLNSVAEAVGLNMATLDNRIKELIQRSADLREKSRRLRSE